MCYVSLALDKNTSKLIVAGPQQHHRGDSQSLKKPSATLGGGNTPFNRYPSRYPMRKTTDLSHGAGNAPPN